MAFVAQCYKSINLVKKYDQEAWGIFIVKTVNIGILAHIDAGKLWKKFQKAKLQVIPIWLVYTVTCSRKICSNASVTQMIYYKEEKLSSSTG